MRYRLGVDGGMHPTVPNNQGTTRPNPARRGRMSAWHPSAAWLVFMVLAEFGAYMALRQAFRHAHGG